MSHIDSLIKLLDDPDDEVYTAIQKELYSQGESIIKKLEETWEHSENKLVQHRIESITHNIQFLNVCNNLTLWTRDENHNLFEALLWISKYQYPELDFEKYHKEFRAIVSDIAEELNDNLTPLEKTRVINHVLFTVHNYSRTFTNSNSPQSFFISNLIDSKKGNFLALCLLYLAVCQELGLPFHGLELPDNMVLAFTTSTVFSEVSEQDVLFYINPSNKGSVFSRLEIDTFLQKINVERNTIFYKPVSNKHLLVAMLKSLMHAFEQAGYKDKVNSIKRLIKEFAPEML